MPIITKPNCLDADYFFVCKGNEILVKDNSFISKKEFEFFANETFSDDWYIEKNLSFAAALAKENCSAPENCKFISVRQFCFEHKETAFLASRAASILKQRSAFKFCPSCKGKLIDDEINLYDSDNVAGIQNFLKIQNINITKRAIYNAIKNKNLIKNKYSVYKIKVK